MPHSIETDLWTHARALRSVARALVGDQHADDLVQETTLQALHEPKPPAAFRGWLFTVLRRLASKHHRAERRRQQRETKVLPPASTPPPDRIAEHRDTLQKLTAALMALPAPYQGTLLLRFFEDLPPSEIAARMDVPVATVKTRLQRGLAMLRERLGAEAEGNDWRPALCAAFGLEPTLAVGTSTAVTITGVVLMGTGVKLAIGATAAALAVVAGLLFARADAPVSLPVTSASADTKAATGAIAPRADATSDTSERREPVLRSTVAPAVATVQGRCVDADGKPLGGCDVRVRGVPGSRGRVEAWLRDHGPFPWNDPAPVLTGTDGTFVLQVPPSGPRMCEFTASADDRAEATARWPELVDGGDRNLGDVVLRRLVTVRLRVVDRTKQPVPDVTLVLLFQDQDRATMPRAVTVMRTDAAGRSEVLMAAGQYSLPSVAGNDTSHLTVPDDDPVFEKEIELRGPLPESFIRGFVTASGEGPVGGAYVFPSGAAVAELSTPGVTRAPGTQTMADGSFVLPRPARSADEPVTLHCVADGYDGSSTVMPIAWGECDVQLNLRRGMAAEVRVRQSDTGNPVENYDLTIRPWQSFAPYHQHNALGRHPAGVAVLDPLNRGNYLASVVPHDPALCARYDLPIHLGGVGPAVVDMVLDPVASRTLRVERPDGTPVVGTRFEVLDPQMRDGLHGESIGIQTIGMPLQEWLRGGPDRALRLHEGTTDTAGEALLRGPRHQVVVRVSGGAHESLLQDDVSLLAEAPLILIVRAGGTLRGRVGPQELLATTRTRHLQLHREGNVLQSLERTEEVAADGTFVIRGLPPGSWQLEFLGHLKGQRRGVLFRRLATIAVSDGDVLERDFDLRELMPTRFHGTVTVDDKPATGAVLGLMPVDGTRRTENSVAIGAEGAFDLFSRPGRYRLMLTFRPPEELHVQVDELVQLVAGSELERTFAIKTGRLRLQLVDAAGQAVPHVQVQALRSDGTIRTSPRTGDDGRIDLGMETGTFPLRAYVRSLQDDAARRKFEAEHATEPAALAKQLVPLDSVIVTAGNEAWRTVVLPANWFR